MLKRKKNKTVKVSFSLDQLDEMRKKLWDKINSIDFDGFASVDEDGCELQMEFTLEEKDGELKVKDRDYHGVWYTYYITKNQAFLVGIFLNTWVKLFATKMGN